MKGEQVVLDAHAKFVVDEVQEIDISQEVCKTYSEHPNASRTLCASKKVFSGLH